MRIPWTPRTPRLLFVVVILAVLTYPLVNSLLTSARVERSGVDVTATVLETTRNGDSYLVAFRLPEEIDPGQRNYSAEVDRASYDKAAASKQIRVRVLKDRPTAHEVEGEIHSRASWVFTGVADAIVLIVGLWWVKVGRRRPTVRMLAEDDPEPAELDEAGTLTRIEGGRYELVGHVESSSGSEVVVDVGDRKVVVFLGGRSNPVEVGAVLRARGPLVG
jgi:hypothetical protein